jgi:hypothetical protein
MSELIVDFITSLNGYASGEGWPGTEVKCKRHLKVPEKESEGHPMPRAWPFDWAQDALCLAPCFFAHKLHCDRALALCLCDYDEFHRAHPRGSAEADGGVGCLLSSHKLDS